MLIEMIIFIIICFGLTNIIIWGSIFDSIRDTIMKSKYETLKKLIACPMCVGFWVGILIHYTVIPVTNFFGDAILGSIGSHVLTYIDDILMNKADSGSE